PESGPGLHPGPVCAGAAAGGVIGRGAADRRARRAHRPGPQVRLRGGRGQPGPAARHRARRHRRRPAGGGVGPGRRRPGDRAWHPESVHARDAGVAPGHRHGRSAGPAAGRGRGRPLRRPARGANAVKFPHFFIDRPIFAAVLSIVVFAAGLIAIPILPVSEYPEVVPPSVVVRTVYPGANPKVIAETVATPLEEAINGVEDMMYMKSVAGSDGVLQM